MTLTAEIIRPSAVTAPFCAHCALPVPSTMVRRDAEQQFCCGGCEAVYQTLHACGLDAYYRLRDQGDPAIEPAHPTNETFASFDSPTFHRLYVQPRPGGLFSVDLSLAGVTCAACVWLVERLPHVLPGVVEARLSLREATVRLTWNPQQIQLSYVAQSLDRLGYTPHAARSELGREAHRREARKRLIHLGVAGAIMGNEMLLAFGLYAGSYGNMEGQYRTFFRWLSAGLAMISLAWPGATFFRSAWAALRMRTTNLDVPIALALGVGGAAGIINVILNRGEIYFDSLCVLIFLLLVGRFIQYRQQRWADDAVGLLFNLTPSTCRRVEGNETIEIPAEAMAPGDVVEVRAGELFPADGIVLRGESTTSEALLTGESMPAPIRVGSAVHAGAQNIGSVVRVTVQSVGAATRIGKLMHLVEDGIREKPAIVQFADRVGKWFVVAVTLIAVATFAYWSRSSLPMAIDHTVALLIVTCPCVLGLATPLTIAIAIGRLARRDILVKNGLALEQLSRGGSLLLDKTGTLTEGTLQLTAWFGDQSLRPLVAMAEAKSNHPVGRALTGATSTQPDIKRLPADERCWIDGPLTDIVEGGDGGLSARCGRRVVHIGSPTYADRNGVTDPTNLMKDVRLCQAAGSTAIVIAIDRRAVAVAALGDALRHDSASAVRQLAKLHFEPEILSGDAAAVVQSAACTVGIDPANAHGGMSPEQKLQRVQQHEEDGNGDAASLKLAASPFISRRITTVMVGDGVNDAAALAAADVGIAVHGGAEASLAAADVYIAQPGLQPIVELVRMSRRAMRIVRRNLAISLTYNIVAGALAVGGWMTPMIAAIIMPISSATVLGLAVVSIGGFTRPRAGAPR